VKKDSALRIRLDSELHQQFLAVCRVQDKPAAQVLREFMRSYVKQHQAELEAGETANEDQSSKTK
jgi:hypothetical protein